MEASFRQKAEKGAQYCVGAGADGPRPRRVQPSICERMLVWLGSWRKGWEREREQESREPLDGGNNTTQGKITDGHLGRERKGKCVWVCVWVVGLGWMPGLCRGALFGSVGSSFSSLRCANIHTQSFTRSLFINGTPAMIQGYTHFRLITATQASDERAGTEHCHSFCFLSTQRLGQW